MGDDQVVHVVLVDWGTMDGYPKLVVVHSVRADRADAEADQARVRGRRPFPAVSAVIETVPVT